MMLMTRRALCVAIILTLPLAACSKKDAAPYAVEEVPLTQVVADLAAKKTTSVAVTKAYIARIKQYDAPLHAVILIAPDAEQQAAAADKRRAEGKTLSGVIQDALRQAGIERRLQELRGIQAYWSGKARDKGLLTEQDLARYLSR